MPIPVDDPDLVAAVKAVVAEMKVQTVHLHAIADSLAQMAKPVAPVPADAQLEVK